MTTPIRRTLVAFFLSTAAVLSAAGPAAVSPAMAQDEVSYGEQLIADALELLNARGGDRNPELAERLLTAAAEAQQPAAMYYLARMYIAGDGVEQSAAKAERLLLQAQSLGQRPEISFALGELYELPGPYFSRAKGMVAYQAAIDQGYQGPAAAIGLARTLLSGQPAEADLARVKELIDLAEATEGTPETMRLRGRLLISPGPLQDIPRAVTILERLSQDGDVDATLQLADIYGRGGGVPKDQARAETLYVRAVGQGADTVPVWAALAELYLTDGSAVRDAGQGVAALARLVELGDNPSRTRLARLLTAGGDVPKDYPRARDLLVAYVEAGAIADGSRALGDLYLQDSPLRDYQLAVEYYQVSADTGDPFGMMMLARAYAFGWGGEVDSEKAIALANRSVDAGNRLFGLDALGDVLSQSDLADGPSRAAEAWTAAAELGNGTSMVKLGRLLFGGRIPADYPTAQAMLERARDTSAAPQAWTALGDLLLAEANPGRDPVEGEAAYRKAAELGDGAGMVALGRLLMAGDRTDESVAEIKDLLQRAVAAGQANMANKLLGDLAMSYPVPDGNRREALAAYAASAAAGNGEAHLIAAGLEADGFGEAGVRSRVLGHLYAAKALLGPARVTAEMFKLPRRTLIGLTQQLLVNAGQQIRVDGRHRSGTTRAIGDFCEARSLDPCETGFVTVDLLEALLTPP